MPNGNPMNLSWPITPAAQPGATNGSGSYDISKDIMTCPIDNSLCHRIGSGIFDWRCDGEGHQFQFPVGGQPGIALFLGSSGAIIGFVLAPGSVRDQRGYT
jgi:hypothetical protein